MSHIRRRGITYRVEIYREGHRESSTHTTRQSAKEWAQEVEAELGRRLFANVPGGGMQSLSEGVRSKIPWQELAMNAEECAELFGMTAEYFLRAVACKPTFPVRLTRKPATWKAGEVIEWRDSHRVG